MILLTSIADALQLVTDAAVALDVHASWVDLGNGVRVRERMPDGKEEETEFRRSHPLTRTDKA